MDRSEYQQEYWIHTCKKCGYKEISFEVSESLYDLFPCSDGSCPICKTDDWKIKKVVEKIGKDSKAPHNV